MIPPLTDRISLLELVDERFPFPLNAVEIGVAGGHFTKQLVVSLKNLGFLYCVDPWKHFDEGYDDSCNLSKQEQEERYQQFQRDFALNEHVSAVRLMSHEASKTMLPESIHFIYLDANHSYTEVLRDRTCWWPILKPGGIFAGHDYYEGNGAGHGVKLAVDSFAAERGLTVHRTTHEFCRKEGVYGAGWEGFSFALEKP
jgi:hypothetical protein